jgi:hypothetical protein
MNMVCPPTITAPTGSWARRRETSRADVRPTHRATVRSDERARPPRRDGRARRSSTTPPQAPGRRVRARQTRLHTKFFRFENPATPAKGTMCFRNFSIGNNLFTPRQPVWPSSAPGTRCVHATPAHSLARPHTEAANRDGLPGFSRPAARLLAGRSLLTCGPSTRAALPESSPPRDFACRGEPPPHLHHVDILHFHDFHEEHMFAAPQPDQSRLSAPSPREQARCCFFF